MNSKKKIKSVIINSNIISHDLNYTNNSENMPYKFSLEKSSNPSYRQRKKHAFLYNYSDYCNTLSSYKEIDYRNTLTQTLIKNNNSLEIRGGNTKQESLYKLSKKKVSIVVNKVEDNLDIFNNIKSNIFNRQMSIKNLPSINKDRRNSNLFRRQSYNPIFMTSRTSLLNAHKIKSRKTLIGRTSVLVNFGASMIQNIDHKYRKEVIAEVNNNILKHNNNIKVKFYMPRSDNYINTDNIFTDCINTDVHKISKNKSLFKMIEKDRSFRRLQNFSKNIRCLTEE